MSAPSPAVSTPVVADAPGVMRTHGWDDYALLDSGDGRKLERYGAYTVVRPEPQCLWRPKLPAETWADADAVFDPSDDEDAGHWRFKTRPPESFPLAWGQARFNGRFTAFRHLAFFPEQAANWAWLDERVRGAGDQPRVLNLFGYTGVASLVMAAAGAAVTHVDGTARVQTLERAMAPRLYDLLMAYGRRSGMSVLLNTSFNLAGEPIVNRSVEGYSTFRRSGIDVLVAGAVRVVKPALARARLQEVFA